DSGKTPKKFSDFVAEMDGILDDPSFDTCLNWMNLQSSYTEPENAPPPTFDACIKRLHNAFSLMNEVATMRTQGNAFHLPSTYLPKEKVFFGKIIPFMERLSEFTNINLYKTQIKELSEIYFNTY